MKIEYTIAFPSLVGTVVPGFRVLGFSVLPGFRALKAADGAWSVHKTLFGFRAPLPQLLINKIWVLMQKVKFCLLNSRIPLNHIFFP